MKYFCIAIVLSIFSVRLHAQTHESNGEDYVVVDTSLIALTSGECNRYVSRTVKKMQKCTLRLQKTNNYYLHLYFKQEDAFLHSLCTLPASNFSGSTITDQARLKSYEISDNATSALNTNGSDAGLRNEHQQGSLPFEEMPFSIPSACSESEVSAEALMMDAWYSFNRFENRSSRESNQIPDKYNSEVDSITCASNYLMTKCATCDSDKLSAVQTERHRLQQEMKRSELIQEYVHDRYQYMLTVMQDVPGGSTMLLPIKKLNYYLGSQLKECQALFQDRSPIERLVMASLSKSPLFHSFVDLKGQLGGIVKSPMVTPSQPKLNLESLLENAPIESKSIVASLVKGVKMTPNNDAATIAKDVKEEALKEKHKVKSTYDQYNANKEEMKSSVDSLKLAKKDDSKEKDSEWNPNPLKTKRFVDRLSYTANFQFDRRNSFLPASSTLAAGLSYQYFKNGNLGISGNFIQPMPKVQLHAEDKWSVPVSSGFGVRSFLDLKVRKSLFVQAGYERNFRPYNTGVANYHGGFNAMNSAMAGLKIVYPVKNKKSNPTLEIMYDFLHRSTGQPAFVMRTGIVLKGKHHLK